MERRVIIFDNVEYFLEEEDNELSDDDFLSSDNGVCYGKYSSFEPGFIFWL